MTRWNDYTATIPVEDHAALMAALGRGLEQARKASEVATGNGETIDAADYAIEAVIALMQVVKLLTPLLARRQVLWEHEARA